MPEETDSMFEALKAARPSWEKTERFVESPNSGRGLGHFMVQPSAYPTRSNRASDYRAQFPESTNTETQLQDQGGATSNQYDFECFDATDKDGNKVNVLDGVVYYPNGTGSDGAVPAGMGQDDFEIAVQNGDDIYMRIPIDFGTWEQTSEVTIHAAPTTPDDDDFNLYVTIGTVSIDDKTKALTINNTICGDWVIIPDLVVTGTNGGLDGPDLDGITQINFSEAFFVEADSDSPFGNIVFVDTALSVEGENGGAVENVNDINFTTNGDEFIDVAVSGSRGSAEVLIKSSENLQQTLQDLQNQIDALQNFNDNITDC